MLVVEKNELEVEKLNSSGLVVEHRSPGMSTTKLFLWEEANFV